MNKGEGMGIFFLLNSVSGKIFSFHWRKSRNFSANGLFLSVRFFIFINLFKVFGLKYLDELTIRSLKGEAMTITNFQVQNIIKAYRVQSAVRSRMGKEKNVKNVPQRDEVNFSPESKKRLLAERITEGLKQQLFRGEERSETIQRALDQLSQEYGKNLDFDIGNEGSLTFTVTDPKSRARFKCSRWKRIRNCRPDFLISPEISFMITLSKEGETMKISEIQSTSTSIQNLQQAQESNPLDKIQNAQERKPTPEKDRVDLSAEAKEMKKIHDTLSAAPDVRAEKVEAIQEQLRENRYRIDPEALADKMIRQALMDLNS
jgi:negative regulator of flagellin synthesis FlgM